MEQLMKRIAYVFLAEIVLTGMLVGVSGAQSEPLGDYARSVRKGRQGAGVGEEIRQRQFAHFRQHQRRGKCHRLGWPRRRQPGARHNRPPSRKTGPLRLPLQDSAGRRTTEDGRQKRRLEAEDCRSAGQG